jgi:hypothetical protein
MPNRAASVPGCFAAYIVLAYDYPARCLRLLMPLRSLAGVIALRLGDLLLDLETFQDEQIMR